ncbi:MAG: MerR family transcriptional regulator [Paracoccaceae bacterium]|nr:MerR family transcriptional regulator [Paracoccaceae bacterium]
MDQKSPDAFRTISEVAEWLDTPAHVLRFWESRFPQVKPVKRAGGRRYYRPSDMALLGGIKKLLHEDGLTIRGVQKLLRSEGVRRVAALSPPLDDIGAPMVEDAEPASAEVLLLRDPEQPAAPPEAAASPEPEGEPSAGAEAEAETAPSEARETEDDFEAELAAALAEPGAEVAAGPPFESEATPEPVAPAPPEPAPAPPAAAATAPPEAPQRPDLSAIPPVPEDGDPSFAPPPSPFPLSDPRAARERLAANPAKAAALYARLVDLAAQMGARPR